MNQSSVNVYNRKHMKQNIQYNEPEPKVLAYFIVFGLLVLITNRMTFLACINIVLFVFDVIKLLFIKQTKIIITIYNCDYIDSCILNLVVVLDMDQI